MTFSIRGRWTGNNHSINSGLIDHESRTSQQFLKDKDEKHKQPRHALPILTALAREIASLELSEYSNNDTSSGSMVAGGRHLDAASQTMSYYYAQTKPLQQAMSRKSRPRLRTHFTRECCKEELLPLGDHSKSLHPSAKIRTKSVSPSAKITQSASPSRTKFVSPSASPSQTKSVSPSAKAKGKSPQKTHPSKEKDGDDSKKAALRSGATGGEHFRVDPNRKARLEVHMPRTVVSNEQVSQLDSVVTQMQLTNEMKSSVLDPFSGARSDVPLYKTTPESPTCTQLKITQATRNSNQETTRTKPDPTQVSHKDGTLYPKEHSKDSITKSGFPQTLQEDELSNTTSNDKLDSASSHSTKESRLKNWNLVDLSPSKLDSSSDQESKSEGGGCNYSDDFMSESSQKRSNEDDFVSKSSKKKSINSDEQYDYSDDFMSESSQKRSINSNEEYSDDFVSESSKKRSINSDEQYNDFVSESSQKKSINDNEEYNYSDDFVSESSQRKSINDNEEYNYSDESKRSINGDKEYSYSDDFVSKSSKRSISNDGEYDYSDDFVPESSSSSSSDTLVQDTK